MNIKKIIPAGIVVLAIAGTAAGCGSSGPSKQEVAAKTQQVAQQQHAEQVAQQRQQAQQQAAQAKAVKLSNARSSFTTGYIGFDASLTNASKANYDDDSMAAIYAAASRERFNVKQLMPLVAVDQQSNLTSLDQALDMTEKGVQAFQTGDYTTATADIQNGTAMLKSTDVSSLIVGGDSA